MSKENYVIIFGNSLNVMQMIFQLFFDKCWSKRFHHVLKPFISSFSKSHYDNKQAFKIF